MIHFDTCDDDDDEEFTSGHPDYQYRFSFKEKSPLTL